jgi:esterase/lipase
MVPLRNPDRPNAVILPHTIVSRTESSPPLTSRDVPDTAHATYYKANEPMIGNLVVPDGVNGFAFDRRFFNGPMVPTRYNTADYGGLPVGAIVAPELFADPAYLAMTQEASYDYFPVHAVSALLAQGWNVVSLNYPAACPDQMFNDSVRSLIARSVDYASGQHRDLPTYVVGRSLGGRFALEHLAEAHNNGSRGTFLLNPAFKLRSHIQLLMHTPLVEWQLKKEMRQPYQIETDESRLKTREDLALHQRIRMMMDGLSPYTMHNLDHIETPMHIVYSLRDGLVDGAFTKAVVKTYMQRVPAASRTIEELRIANAVGKERHDPMYHFTYVILPAFLGAN